MFHRDALVKFFANMLINNFVASISSRFFDDEPPPEGMNHNKGLHISIECVDTLLSRVLVDIGSLSKLTIEGLVMKPNELVVRALDDSRRTVIREVDLPIKIVPHTFFITFYVMDIYPAYSCLFGRPWIL